MNKSAKQISLEHKILASLKGPTLKAAEIIFNDVEIQTIQEYANNVSIRRLGFNDHGPVHMRKAALNAMTMFNLLVDNNIKMSLEKEEFASVEESRLGVFLASMLHDLGMTITRDKHELISLELARPFIDKILNEIYTPEEIEKKVAVRSITLEGIFGHMATQKVHSIEAGLVLIGDGCDMEHGRARITSMLLNQPRVGDMHKYSASAIQKVQILQGEEKPIRILIQMSQSVGLFQIEEVLFTKIASSPVKPYIELFAQLRDEELLQYL